MKRKQLIIGSIISACLFLTACQSEILIGGQEGTNNPQKDGLAYLSVAVNLGDIRTRAEDDWGTVSENKVEKVRMVLYNGGEVKYAFDFDIESIVEDENITGYQDADPENANNLYLPGSTGRDQFVTYARGVVPADYQMLLIINPSMSNSGETNIYDITEVGQSIDLLYDPAEIAAENLCSKENGGVAETGYFMMTNHQDLIDIPEHLLKESVNDANTNPVPVEVSRVVAKVTLDTSHTNSYGGQFYDLTWGLDITNKYTYWMRKMTHPFSWEGIVYEWEFEDESTPREYLYAEDPNFRNYSDQDGGDQWRREEAFNMYFKTDIDMHSPNNSPVLYTPPEEPLYCLENTMAAEDQYTSVITRALIRCNFTPYGINKGESYYVFGNTIISQEQMDGYCNSSYPIPATLEGLSEAIEHTRGEEFTLESPGMAYSFESDGGIKYYKDGINYYAIKIRHFEETRLKERGYGYYGVVRNNHYSIELTSIYGPGSPIVDVDEEAYFALEFEILRWTDREQGNIILH